MRRLRELCGVDLIWSQHSYSVNRCDLWAGQESVLAVTWNWDSPSCFVMKAQAWSADDQWSLQMSWHWGRQLQARKAGSTAIVASFDAGLLKPTGVLVRWWFSPEGTVTVGGHLLRWAQEVPPVGDSGWLARMGRDMATNRGLYPCSFFDQTGRPLITYDSMITTATEYGQCRVLIAPEAGGLPELAALAAMGGLLRLDQGPLVPRMTTGS